jgi:hypothetical protein
MLTNQRKKQLQVKLSMDENLKDIWEDLREYYKGLDKASIIRLAINNLARKTDKDKTEDYPFLTETEEKSLQRAVNDFKKGDYIRVTNKKELDDLFEKI